MKMIYFVSGVIVGIYLDQNYKIPRVEKIVNDLNEALKKYKKS